MRARRLDGLLGHPADPSAVILMPGTVTVGDSLGSGETVEVTWDVMVPEEAIDCGP